MPRDTSSGAHESSPDAFSIGDKELYELLLEIFDLGHLRASSASRGITCEEFMSRYDALTQIVGEPAAEDIVRRGHFPYYTGASMDYYLSLARQAITLISPSDQPQRYHSIEALLGQQTSNTLPGPNAPLLPEIDFSQLLPHLHQYRILHAAHETSVIYLDSLIRSGELIVSENERWNDHKIEGLRGVDITKNIARQIRLIFAELHLEPPSLTMANGRYRLCADERTRTLLGYIRSECYSFQHAPLATLRAL